MVEKKANALCVSASFLQKECVSVSGEARGLVLTFRIRAHNFFFGYTRLTHGFVAFIAWNRQVTHE